MIESINTRVIDNQKMVGKIFWRFHVSDDLSIGELAEIIKFKVNTKIQQHKSLLQGAQVSSLDDEERLGSKERIMFFNNRLSVSDTLLIKDVYDRFRENDGWLYLDFLIEVLAAAPLNGGI